MTEPRTVVDLVERIAGTAGTRPALEAPGRSPLGYSDLATLLARTGEQLRGAGFDRSARLALVLPNGPELAAAVYGVAAFAAAAPLNPAYRREEFDFFLDDLDADALVVMAGDAGPAAMATPHAPGIFPSLSFVPIPIWAPVGLGSICQMQPRAHRSRRLRHRIRRSFCTPRAPRRGPSWCR